MILDVTVYTPPDRYSTHNIISHHSPPRPYAIYVKPTEPPAPIMADLMRNYVYILAGTLSKGRTHRVDSFFDELYGIVIKITTDLTAREALELWLKLVERLAYEKYKIAIAIEWIGENNVNEDELADYLVRIMIKSGSGPAALSGFEAVSAVRETRKE